MAWCENENCNNFGQNIFRKADVEFDDTTKKVLCHGCMAAVHPGWEPPAEFVDLSDGYPRVVRTLEPHFGMAVQVNQQDGIKAAFSYGGISLAIQVPQEDLQRLFGG